MPLEILFILQILFILLKKSFRFSRLGFASVSLCL
jgi:hypothetical protein